MYAGGVTIPSGNALEDEEEEYDDDTEIWFDPERPGCGWITWTGTSDSDIEEEDEDEEEEDLSYW